MLPVLLCCADNIGLCLAGQLPACVWLPLLQTSHRECPSGLLRFMGALCRLLGGLLLNIGRGMMLLLHLSVKGLRLTGLWGIGVLKGLSAR